MTRSLYAVLLGTFTLRFSTGLTGGLLIFYLRDLHVGELTLATLTATFFAAELVLSTPFGLISDGPLRARCTRAGTETPRAGMADRGV